LKRTTFNSAIAEVSIEDFMHPGLRRVKFVFCDDQPNENGQGILADDFEDIIKSSIGTPVKMKFFGQSAGNHLGSIPIGHIVDMVKAEQDGVNKLIADAILYADDYPEEIDYLFHSYAEGKAPGVSWELSYKDSILEKGITWLKGVVTRAATFVRSPAYGNRTAILALASNHDISDEDFQKEVLSELNAEIKPQNNDQGGNNRMEEELQKAREELEALKAANTTALAERDSKISELEARISELENSVSEKDTALAEYKNKEVLAERISKLSEAGITLPSDAEKRAAKEAFYLNLSDEAFAEVVEELSEAIASVKDKEPKKGLASLQSRTPSVPKLTAQAGSEADALSLAEKFKGISRTRDNTQSE
jgi:hypothetical protein